MHKLKALDIKRLPSGLHNDGGCRYLNVNKTGARSWIFRFRRDGRLRDMGLGGFPAVTLAEAREKATDARRQLAAGIDPLDARKVASKPTRWLSFNDASEAYIKGKEKGWRNPRTAQHHRSRLAYYASGGKPGSFARSCAWLRMQRLRWSCCRSSFGLFFVS